MTEKTIDQRTVVSKKTFQENIPTLLTVLSAIITAAVGGYVAFATKNIESRDQVRVAEMQTTSQQKVAEAETGTQKSIAEMQKDAQHSITAEQLKAQLAIADKQSEAQLKLSNAQRNSERYIAEARARTDAEIAQLTEQTKSGIAGQQNTVESAKLFSGLINDLADQNPHKSSVALLVLWQLYPSEEQRSVIIATALAVENKAILPTLKLLGNTDKRGLALIERYSSEGTPQQRTTANLVLGEIKFANNAGNPGLEKKLQDRLRQFQMYLKVVGFEGVTDAVSVELSDKDDAYYYPAQRKIVIGTHLASEPDTILREYAHHVLAALLYSSPKDSEISEKTYFQIESGLAYYFACSFSDNTAFVYRASTFTIRIDLENNYKFQEVPERGRSFDKLAEVWVGAFWQIRKTMGKEEADRLLFRAWTSIDRLRGRSVEESNRAFANKLLQTERSLGGEKHLGRLREIFEGRGLSL